MKRRELLHSAAATLASLAAPASFSATATPTPRHLRASPAVVRAAGQASLDVWAYQAQVPGPVLRYARGSTLDVELDNALPAETTIHFHGVRMPNAMDGVPHLTQDPVPEGGRFRYRFALPDSGTFWYHPHLGAPEQVERGLYGMLIVEDEAAPQVDREWLWVIDDWRLDAQGRIADDFYGFMDVSHAGRLGDVLTVNGQLPAEHDVAVGERVRLRLVNVANARIVALDFGALAAWLIALDGMPLAQAEPLTLPVLLGPGMRADVLVDVRGAPGDRLPIRDVFGRGQRGLDRMLATLRLTGAHGSTATRSAPKTPAPNPAAEPAPASAQSETLVLGGGMMSMGGWPRQSVIERASRWLRRAAGVREAAPAWTVNGAAHVEHRADHPPEFIVERGRSVVLRFDNQTAWWHPMHLHGHSFRELRRNGKDVPGQPWRDTALIPPRQTLDVGFVADNPGDWLIHCHVLEHHAGGMGTTFRVRD